MATGATHPLSFRLHTRRHEPLAPPRDRVFETWRTAIWTAAAIGTGALATTALNVIPGAADEVVMASAFTLTGILGHLAPLSE